MNETLEYRTVTELRTTGRKLAGHAAVFNVRANIEGQWNETIKPGAFTQTLATRSDIVALVDHDPTRLLARTASGTLRLSEDGKGLAFEIDTPDTQLGRDMLALAARNDLGGMSIGFRATSEAWPTADTRELRAIDLVEISIAQAWPAYAGTEIALRSREKSVKLPTSAAARRRILALI
jgi:HK97 family phage prohead protease